MLVYEVCDAHQLAAYYAVCADCCWAATVDLTLYIWNWPEWTKTVKLEVIEPVNDIKPIVTAADLNNFAQVLRKTRPQCLWLLACSLMLTKDTSHQTAGSFVKKKLQLWLRLACSGPLKQPCSFCRVSFPSCFSQRPGQDEQQQRQVLLKSKPLNHLVVLTVVLPARIVDECALSSVIQSCWMWMGEKHLCTLWKLLCCAV